MAVSNPLYKPIKLYTRNTVPIAMKFLHYFNRKKVSKRNSMKINVKVTYYSIIYVQMITSVKLPMSGNVHCALGNTGAEQYH